MKGRQQLWFQITVGDNWIVFRRRCVRCPKWWPQLRGGDIVKALCLGARAVLIGRAYAYGLGAAGQAGVARALEILKVDVDRTIRLLGCPSVKQLDATYLNKMHQTW